MKLFSFKKTPLKKFSIKKLTSKTNLSKKAPAILIALEVLAVCFLLGSWAVNRFASSAPAGVSSGGLSSHFPFSLFREEEDSSGEEKKDFIKWVDFTVPSEALTQAFRMDVATCQQDIHLNWVELLACLGARYGGDFSRYKASDMEALAEKLTGGTPMEELTRDMKYYSYYLEAYQAALGGLLGSFAIEINGQWKPTYGL